MFVSFEKTESRKRANLEFRFIITHLKRRMQINTHTHTYIPFIQLQSVTESSALTEAKNYPKVTATGCMDHVSQQQSSLRAWQGLESSARETHP